ncbi:hypothetical protein BDZ91DRAFT_712769 [Kalaharituber pfeilii]|nr:hypothetical protein BDZ91DRAFT_712769 [Kalaharituber pfeilii]
MTRSHKANDPIHNPEISQLVNSSTIPRNFGKHAAHAEPPNKPKKNGGGKANWGRDGDEIIDSVEFTMNNPRRRSNSKSHIEDQYVRSKFEVNDEIMDEEVFEPASPTTSESTADKS